MLLLLLLLFVTSSQSVPFPVPVHTEGAKSVFFNWLIHGMETHITLILFQNFVQAKRFGKLFIQH